MTSPSHVVHCDSKRAPSSAGHGGELRILLDPLHRIWRERGRNKIVCCSRNFSFAALRVRAFWRTGHLKNFFSRLFKIAGQDKRYSIHVEIFVSVSNCAEDIFSQSFHLKKDILKNFDDGAFSVLLLRWQCPIFLWINWHKQIIY